MEMNKLNEKDLKTIYPNKGNIVFEKMTKEQIEEYLSIYNLYRKLFTEYMIEKLSLKKYDDLIVESNLDFTETLEKHMDIYQYFSSKELRYFYIRNNMYIERLDEQEKEFLKKRIQENNYRLDENSKKIIDTTYKKVTFEESVTDGKKYLIAFGPNNRNFLTSSDSIVIGFRYDKFASSGLDDNEWRERHIKQLEYINQRICEMLSEYKEKFKEDSISIFKYTEFSIRKRST